MSLTVLVVQMIDIKAYCTFVGSSRVRWKHGRKMGVGQTRGAPAPTRHWPRQAVEAKESGEIKFL
jgi:hypothetical protein